MEPSAETNPTAETPPAAETGPVTETKPAEKPRFPIWLAMLPALVVPLFFMVRAALQFGAFADSSGFQSISPVKDKTLACVETYGITPHTSEMYVRKPGLFTNRPKNAPHELSTVLRGMARNGCGERLSGVKLKITVHDDQGNKGSEVVKIEQMESGEARPFEKAWIGRVTSWEIVSSR